jgi:alkaline phosphatase D
MAQGHGSEDRGSDLTHGRSYVGLISVLIVIALFIAALLAAGVQPLKKPAGAHGESQLAPQDTATSVQSASAEESGKGVANASATTANAAAPAATDAGSAALAPSAPLQRIAFGSGLDEGGPMSILGVIMSRDPQLFIFAGNAVYADAVDPKAPGGATRVSSPLMIRAAYARLSAQPMFERFRDRVPIMATWDAHDYGLQNAGADFQYKEASKEAFFAFYGLSKESSRFDQPGGIYQSRLFGPAGKRVQVILLDTRWNLSRPKAKAPNTEKHKLAAPVPATLLGAEQWKWLEQQLIEPADVRLIVSPLQVEADAAGTDGWASMPAARRRLYALLKETGANGVILLSGHRRGAAIYRNDKALSYPLYEVTSSSLNRPLPDTPAPPVEPDPARLQPLYHGANFGMINIDWQAKTVGLEIRDETGGLIQSLTVPVQEAPPQN